MKFWLSRGARGKGMKGRCWPVKAMDLLTTGLKYLK